MAADAVDGRSRYRRTVPAASAMERMVSNLIQGTSPSATPGPQHRAPQKRPQRRWCLCRCDREALSAAGFLHCGIARSKFKSSWMFWA